MRDSLTHEPFRLEDGHLLLHEDGSTTLTILVPPGRGGPHGGAAQFNRLQRRLLELALTCGPVEEDG